MPAVPKAKGLTRKIKRSQALSYERSRPNRTPRGVTSIVEINGPGAYDRRYRRTRKLLSSTEKNMPKVRMTKEAFLRKQVRKGRSLNQAKASWKLVSGSKRPKRKAPRYRPNYSPSLGAAASKQLKGRKTSKAKPKTSKKRSKRSAAKGQYSAHELKLAKAKIRSGKPPTKRQFDILQHSRAGKKAASASKAPKKETKKAYVARMEAANHSPSQIKHWWALKTGKVKPGEKIKRSMTPAQKAARTRKAQKSRGVKLSRYYGKGTFKSARAKVGKTSRNTYKYVSPKGTLRDIPDYALLGFPTRAAYNKAIKTYRGKQMDQLKKRVQSIADRRVKAAAAAEKRILAGKGLFVPNKVTMKKKYRRNKGNGGAYLGRKALKSPAAIGKKFKKGERLYKTEKEILNRALGGKTTKKATVKKATVKKATVKKATVKKAATKKKRPLKKTFIAAQKRKGRSSAQAAQDWRFVYGTKKGKKASTKKRKAAPKRKAKIVRLGKSKSRTVIFRKNARKSYKRKSYRRNVGGAAYVMELKKALKIGVFVTGGFAVHRALSRLLEDQALVKVDAFTTGSAAPFRGVISSLIVAGVGIPVAVRLLPGGGGASSPAATVASGMAASLIHKGLVTLLGELEQPKLAGYLQGYPNASGKAYGSYYSYKPHQQMGEYYKLGQSGFGQPMMQAAAGYGQPMMQAAAGYGQPMMQAAAGMGKIMQAAAGTGEYYAQQPYAVGEYEEVQVPMGSSPVVDGIHPNLHSAEEALSVAEAASGFGGGGVPMQSTFEPTMEATSVSELPKGSRAGILAGGDGIFG